MKKTNLFKWLCTYTSVIFCFATFSNGQTYSIILSVPLYTQEHSWTCWVAACASVLSYYGKTTSQSDINNYGTSGVNMANWLCGDTFFTVEKCTRWLPILQYLSLGIQTQSCTGSPIQQYGMNSILNHFGQIKTDACISGFYDWNTIKNEICGGRPVCARMYGTYYSTYGHQVIVRGLSFDGANYNYFVMDSRSGHGYETRTKAQFEAEWTYTLRLKTPPPQFVVPLLLKHTIYN
jgi:hypothetical protein